MTRSDRFSVEVTVGDMATRQGLGPVRRTPLRTRHPWPMGHWRHRPGANGRSGTGCRNGSRHASWDLVARRGDGAVRRRLGHGAVGELVACGPSGLDATTVDRLPPGFPGSAKAPARPVSASIPRVVAVQLGRDGHPVRLWTNTGTCPRGDERIVVDRAGHPTRATSELRREIARHVYRGDWSQVGVWHTW